MTRGEGDSGGSIGDGRMADRLRTDVDFGRSVVDGSES